MQRVSCFERKGDRDGFDGQPCRTPLVAAVTATFGHVLFTGDLDNNFLVLDASTETHCTSSTPAAVGGGVVTYEIDRKQYVATTSGVVSGFFGGSGTSAIIVFALH